MMERIDLVETLDALRAELATAVDRAAGQPIEFPVNQIELEFQVGVTRAAEGKGGVRFWVVELGGAGSYAAESVQKVTIRLDQPVDSEGRPIRVTRGMGYKP
jgi:Trypsin-co-occurring domain 2